MGTIIERKRTTGTRYTAQIRIKRDGSVVHQEALTFSQRDKAKAWIEKREKELDKPGGIEKAMKAPKGDSHTLKDTIDKYLEETEKTPGRTKAQVLKTIKSYDIATKPCDLITTQVLVAFGKELRAERRASTVSTYFSHLSKIFELASPAWGYPLDFAAFQQARAVLKELGTIQKSKERDRRPSLDELDKMQEHFIKQREWAPDAVPMDRIIPFAIASTRRQEEIVTARWEDFDEEGRRLLIRDMKDPKRKWGNNIWVELPPEAVAIIKAMPKVSDKIFPYTTDAVTAAFTRTRRLVGIDEELVFHCLRHEGVSRLFEMGKTIPQVASVSGHKSWQSLKRYTHLRQTGDKYADWKWFAHAARPWEEERKAA
jgi:integrase